MDALGVALLVAGALEDVGAEYFVGGSIASSLQGEPRSTNDIDFVIALPLGRINAFRDALGPDFELDVAMLRDALLCARCANAFYLPLVTKIDFFGRGYEPYDEVEFLSTSIPPSSADGRAARDQGSGGHRTQKVAVVSAGR